MFIKIILSDLKNVKKVGKSCMKMQFFPVILDIKKLIISAEKIMVYAEISSLCHMCDRI